VSERTEPEPLCAARSPSKPTAAQRMPRRQFVTSLLALPAPLLFGQQKGAPVIQPRHVLCVLGRRDWIDVARRVVSGFGNGFWLDTDYSIDEPDSRMPQAFEASFDRVAPSFADEDVQAIRDHQAVAYVLSPHMTSTTAPQMSELALKLIAELLMAGGTAVKSDSCGIAHGRTQWLGLAKSAAGDARDRLAALHITWERRPLSDRELLHPCGMHLLGSADIEVTAGS